MAVVGGGQRGQHIGVGAGAVVGRERLHAEPTQLGHHTCATFVPRRCSSIIKSLRSDSVRRVRNLAEPGGCRLAAPRPAHAIIRPCIASRTGCGGLTPMRFLCPHISTADADLPVLLVLLVLAALPAVALGAPAGRTIRYHGHHADRPGGVAMYPPPGRRDHVRALQPARRLSRHAQPEPDLPGRRRRAHRGHPSSPAAVGRRRPRLLLPPGPAPATVPELSAGQAADGVAVTATWNRNPATIEHALGLRSLTAAAAAPAPGARVGGGLRPERPPSVAPRPAAAAQSSATALPSTAGEIYTGSGF